MEGEGSASNNIGECNRCLDVSVDPVVTKCGHIFCDACLRRWLASKPGLDQPCPVCNGVLKRYGSVNRICNGPRLTGLRGRPIPPAVPRAFEQVPKHTRRPRAGAARDSHEKHPARPHRSRESLLASRSERETREGLAISPPRAVETLDPLPHPHEHQEQEDAGRGLALPRDPATALNHQRPDEGCRHSFRAQSLVTPEARIRVPDGTRTNVVRITNRKSPRVDPSRQQVATSLERRRETPLSTSRVRRRRHSVMSRQQVTAFEAHAEGPSTPHRPTTSRLFEGNEHVNPVTVQPAPSEVLVYDESVGARHEHGKTLARSELAGGETPRIVSTDHMLDNVAPRASAE